MQRLNSIEYFEKFDKTESFRLAIQLNLDPSSQCFIDDISDCHHHMQLTYALLCKAGILTQEQIPDSVLDFAYFPL
jgi:hypothetical protein